MRPILLDTNAYTGFKQGHKEIVEIIQQAEQIVISPVVLGELLGGFDNGAKANQNRKELQQFLESSRIRNYSLTFDTSNFYAQIYSSLKVKGKPIPTNDMWIAAQALENGCIICSYDKHFRVIDGLLSGASPSEIFL